MTQSKFGNQLFYMEEEILSSQLEWHIGKLFEKKSRVHRFLIYWLIILNYSQNGNTYNVLTKTVVNFMWELLNKTVSPYLYSRFINLKLFSKLRVWSNLGPGFLYYEKNKMKKKRTTDFKEMLAIRNEPAAILMLHSEMFHLLLGFQDMY